ncbi:MAG: YraN family protein [Chloroflexi bacterium]|nr:YraN family protein [Chloroflexota bacterium]
MLGEKLARDFLKKCGYHILEANYRGPEGEIDLIARHRDELVFIEVRTKKSLAFGGPAESITVPKAQRLQKLAYRYRQSHPDSPQQWRVDVVAIELSPVGKLLRLEIIENAVTEN